MGRRKNTAVYDVPDEQRRLVCKVEAITGSGSDEYETLVQAGTTGDEAIKAIALLVYNITKREQKFTPTFSSSTTLRSVEAWLRILEDEQ